METKLNFTLKDVFGRTLAYPMNEQAKRTCALTKRETLTMDQLKILKEMGFEIIQVQAEVNLD